MRALVVTSLACLAVLPLALPACSDDAPAPAPTMPDGGDVVADPDGITSLPAGEWTQIPTGGDTACSDGSPYSFFVRPGTVNRVIVEFSGGGACWDPLTCSFGSQLFLPNIDPSQAPWLGTPRGIYDHARAENPFKDWHHVFVPYCTGDVHWGNNDKEYSASTRIRHFGARNARAVMEWLYANLQKPEKVMSAGCSAGGYGSLLWAPFLRQHYATSKVYQLSDSAVGAISSTFFEKVRDSWQIGTSLPTFVAGLEDPASVDRLNVFYQRIGAFYPDMPLAQFNSFADEVQTAYYERLGGSGSWSTQMTTAVGELESTVPTFRGYVAPGTDHCVLPTNGFYGVSVGGTSVASWVRAQVEDAPVANVSCEPSCQ